MEHCTIKQQIFVWVIPPSHIIPSYVAGPFLAPSTASLSASTLPGWFACPLIHKKLVWTCNLSRSSIFTRTFSTMSLFSTALPADVFHPFLRQLINHVVTQSMAYRLSVMITTCRFLGTISSALEIAVSSARWLVCRDPGKVSEIFLSQRPSVKSYSCLSRTVNEPLVAGTKIDPNASKCPCRTIP